MRKQNCFLFLILFSANYVFALNMERFGAHRPNFFVHSLDVELHGDLALVTGYGGLMIYDISEGVEFIGRYASGGQRGLAYNCCAQGNIVYAAGRELSSVFIIDISNPQNPIQFATWQSPGQSFEDCAVQGDLLIVSAHLDGLYLLDVSNPRQPELTGRIEDMENCWELAIDDSDNLYVADGIGGLVIINIEEDPELISRSETAGGAIDVKVSGNRCAVAMGAAGVDVFDVNNPSEPQLIGHIDTPTYAGHIGFDGDLVAVADWNETLVYDISDPENIVLDGRRFTEYRAMGVDIRENRVYVADWSKFIGYNYGPIQGADIAFSTRRIIPAGEDDVDTTIFIFSQGTQNLVVQRIRCNAPQFVVDPANFELEPDDTLELAFSYQPHETSSYPLQFSSNDTDDPNSSITLEPFGGLSIGDEAPDFSSRILGGGNYRLSDTAGRIQLIIFWTSW